MLKAIFTIFCSILLFNGYTQVDSMLQRMIEDAKKNPVSPGPVKKDSPVTKKNTALLIKKDSLKPVVKRDSGLRQILSDTPALRTPVTTNAATALPPAPERPVSRIDSVSSDSPVIATNPVITDSSRPLAAVSPPIPWAKDTAFRALLKIHITELSPKVVLKQGDYHVSDHKDYLFYLLIGLVFLLALIKQLFPRYLQNVFGMLFQANYRQKQTREILMQDRFPSLMLNILFILVTGTFLSLLIDSGEEVSASMPDIPFWNLVFYSISFLAIVYLFKYLTTLCLGWAFNVNEAARLYNFIVFIVNKVFGLLLLPIVLLMAFSSGEVRNICITVAAVVVVILLLLRYGMSFVALRKHLNLKPFHFFIYLCAIEIMPLLIVYKALVIYLGKSNF